jgi:hypothetical protein
MPLTYATKGNPHGSNTHEIVMTPEARELWCELYPQITRDLDGKAGSLMARSEVYARMLAMVFCLMDRRSEIEPCDLRAALAWVEYWHQSITYIFLTGDDEPEVDAFTTAVLELVAGPRHQVVRAAGALAPQAHPRGQGFAGEAAQPGAASNRDAQGRQHRRAGCPTVLPRGRVSEEREIRKL